MNDYKLIECDCCGLGMGIVFNSKQKTEYPTYCYRCGHSILQLTNSLLPEYYNLDKIPDYNNAVYRLRHNVESAVVKFNYQLGDTKNEQ